MITVFFALNVPVYRESRCDDGLRNRWHGQNRLYGRRLWIVVVDDHLVVGAGRRDTAPGRAIRRQRNLRIRKGHAAPAYFRDREGRRRVEIELRLREQAIDQAGRYDRGEIQIVSRVVLEPKVPDLAEVSRRA